MLTVIYLWMVNHSDFFVFLITFLMMLFNFLQSINSILIVRLILEFSFKNFSVTTRKEKNCFNLASVHRQLFMVLPMEKSVPHLKGSFSCDTLPISSLLSIRHEPSRMTRKEKVELELQTCPHGTGKGKVELEDHVILQQDLSW